MACFRCPVAASTCCVLGDLVLTVIGRWRRLFVGTRSFVIACFVLFTVAMFSLLWTRDKRLGGGMLGDPRNAFAFWREKVALACVASVILFLWWAVAYLISVLRG